MTLWRAIRLLLQVLLAAKVCLRCSSLTLGLTVSSSASVIPSVKVAVSLAHWPGPLPGTKGQGELCQMLNLSRSPQDYKEKRKETKCRNQRPPQFPSVVFLCRWPR